MAQLVCDLSGIEHRDALVIQSMLRLFEKKLETPWACTSEPGATGSGERCDVALVDVDSDQGRRRWQPASESALVSVAFTSATSAPHNWVLRKPLRSQSIVTLFNDLAVWLRPREGARVENQASQNDTAWTVAENLATAIELVLKQQQPAVLRYSDSTWIAMCPELKVFVSSIGLHTLFQQLTPDKVNLHLVNDWEFAKGMIPNGAAQTARNWNELLWVAHLRTNTARAATIPVDRQVHLKRWPNFTVLPHAPQHLRLAAMFTNRTLTLQQAATVTSVPVNEVRLFVSACVAADLIAEPEAPVSAVAPVSPAIPADRAAVSPQLPSMAPAAVSPMKPASPAPVHAPPPPQQQQKRAGLLRGLLNRLGILQ